MAPGTKNISRALRSLEELAPFAAPLMFPNNETNTDWGFLPVYDAAPCQRQTKNTSKVPVNGGDEY